MDFDPLADSGPSRYAVESDEEDEYNPLAEHPKLDKQDKFRIKISGRVAQGTTLLAAFGDAGKYWAKGADLGEQIGAVFVNDIQVAFTVSLRSHEEDCSDRLALHSNLHGRKPRSWCLKRSRGFLLL